MSAPRPKLRLIPPPASAPGTPHPEWRLSPGLRVLAGALSVLTLGLCAWQLERDGERNVGRELALQRGDAPALDDSVPLHADLAWNTATFRGRLLPPAVLLSGIHDKQRGYDLAQVLQRADGSLLLVDRGWVSSEAAPVTVAGATRAEGLVITGQLRPLTGDAAVESVDGHGTRIWPPGARRSAARSLGADESLILVAGQLDGAPTGAPGLADGFDRVPERDNTSLHYATQWLAISGIGLLFAFPGPLLYLRQKVRA